MNFPDNNYLTFDDQDWNSLIHKEPFSITLDRLPIQISDAQKQAYLFISTYISIQYQHWVEQQKHIDHYLKTQNSHHTYIIGLAGGVAVGKTTTATLLKGFLTQLLQTDDIKIVSTDNFLLPNAKLNEKGLMDRKGFPESYHTKALLQFLNQVKLGEKNIQVPIYSHQTYDVSPDTFRQMTSPCVLILEGINVLERTPSETESITDFLNHSLYIDAPETMAIKWYWNRVSQLYEKAKEEETSYFKRFSALTRDEFEQVAMQTWDRVNGPNLKQYISPTMNRANVIISKGLKHQIKQIHIKKY
ncbi:type I pantothenate kinase [Terrilactibacillus sp. BCM23-1]|uniref:Pantothenate kinase n=1 Tax=Terrilactibacillus tamarindi TaxID=2599694 RepID=A0A6N8CT52_9BACI|nr:type I pantothenate kinase [Terrilactibacillus tamarindi]MTT33241.1 type I pantothenate kinase [Terrilactibacillus tamarindi]